MTLEAHLALLLATTFFGFYTLGISVEIKFINPLHKFVYVRMCIHTS